MSKSKEKFYVQIRTYPDDLYCSCWINKQEGAVTSGVLHGFILIETAESLAGQLGLPIEREACPYKVARDATGAPTGEVLVPTGRQKRFA